MQVMVFISKGGDTVSKVPSLLVLPDKPDARIPQHLRGANWNYFATVSSGDKLIGASVDKVEQDLEADGYSVVSPTH